MMPAGSLIQRYVARAVAPYLVLSLIVLTAILFIQQMARFSELMITARVPQSFFADLALAMIPPSLAFSIPMAVLSGTIIGLGRMGTDSELIALRAAGVSTWRILQSPLLIGIALTALTFWLNFNVNPASALELRRAGLRATLYKMDSPVDPRSFNVDFPGYILYVRDGDRASGTWGRVFLFAHPTRDSTQLVTARTGRIDSSGDRSELVLEDVMRTTIPDLPAPGHSDYVTERFRQLRVVLETGRNALRRKLAEGPTELDEMDWNGLARFEIEHAGKEGLEAALQRHRRLALSVAPVIFALFGVSLGLRVKKGGRGLATLMSLASIVGYYLLMLSGEQMVRAGTLGIIPGMWLATSTALVIALLLLAGAKIPLYRHVVEAGRTFAWNVLRSPGLRWTEFGRTGAGNLGFPGLLDASTIKTLLWNFSLVLLLLILIFDLFTLFELWRYLATSGGWRMGARYLLFLLPLVTVQVLPASVLVAVLATYAVMARRSEVIVWWACGQSLYRLAWPGLIFAACIGFMGWIVQERVMPGANIRQDELRSQIRSGGLSRVTTNSGRQWLAGGDGATLYSYDFDETHQRLLDPVVYQFNNDQIHLRRVVAGGSGAWTTPHTLVIEEPRTLGIDSARPEGWQKLSASLPLPNSDGPEVFKPSLYRASQLSAKRLSNYIMVVRARGGDIVPLKVALQRKFADPFAVVIMALLGIPLAVAFGRRSAVAALCFAVGLGVLYWGIVGGFQQLGSYDLLPAAVAAWSPPFIGAAAGIYLFGRSRT